MTLSQLNEQLERLDEMSFSNLYKILQDPVRLNKYYQAIVNKEYSKLGTENFITDENSVRMKRAQIDNALNKAGYYLNTKASNVQGMVNTVLNYYAAY